MTTRRGRIAAPAALIALLAGCSGDRRVEVEGTVTYDGQPISVGSIHFLPAFEKGIKVGGPIRDGHYKLEAKFGAMPGSYRVEFRWLKPTGEKYKNEFGNEYDRTSEGLPDKYHKDSKETAEITSGKNTFDFKLEK